MKKSIIASAVALASLSLSAQAEVSLFNYTQANSNYTDAFLKGSFDSKKNRSDAQSSYNGTLGISYNTAVDTMNRVFSFNSSAQGYFSRGSNDGDKSVSNYTASAEGKVDSYFNPSANDAFWFGSLGLKADNLSSPTGVLDVDNLQYRAGVGVGYGRIVNLTPMAKAIRVVEELQKRGLLNGEPSAATQNAVANVINKEKAFRSQYGAENYVAKWVEAVAAALEAPINAAGGIAIRDVLVDERISTRKSGYAVRAGLGYEGNTAHFLQDDPTFFIEADYHRPLSNQTQFSNEFEVSTTLGSDDRTYRAQNLMTLTHEIGNRLDWENTLKTDYINPERGNDITTNTMKTALIYDINNALDFNVYASLVNENGGANDGTDRSMGMGFTYRLR